jgi:hypothetical protein
MMSGTTMRVVVSMTALFCMTAWAQPRGGPGRGPEPRFESPRRVLMHPPERARRVFVGGTPYWVDAGVYYQLGDDGYVVVSAPVVRALPPRSRVIVVGGIAYYEWEDVYYRPGPGGYVVVEAPREMAPVAIPAKPDIPSGTQTLYVPKKAGDGFVPVTLKKVDGGYIGPQGEFYPTMPAVALLTEMYGLDDQTRLVPSNVFFIYVPNKDGKSFTRVMLTRRDQGFVGPQGEFYPLMPTVAHLAEMYAAGQEPPASRNEESTIRLQIPRKDGQGTVEVPIKKTDQGYVGPKGEVYDQMPTQEQLTPVYGG